MHFVIRGSLFSIRFEQKRSQNIFGVDSGALGRLANGALLRLRLLEFGLRCRVPLEYVSVKVFLVHNFIPKHADNESFIDGAHAHTQERESETKDNTPTEISHWDANARSLSLPLN